MGEYASDMLTEGNLKYLQTISDEERATIVEFNPKAQETGKVLVAELQRLLPDAQVLYFGSSALGIAGENDIDLGVVDVNEYQANGKALREKYGEPTKVDEKNRMIRWEFERNGFIVEMFLADDLVGMQKEHIENHEKLARDGNLRRKYEELKRASSELSKREYMRRKLEFFNSLAG